MARGQTWSSLQARSPSGCLSTLMILPDYKQFACPTIVYDQLTYVCFVITLSVLPYLRSSERASSFPDVTYDSSFENAETTNSADDTAIVL